MNKYSHILVVLPCHSLEDFPIHHRGDDAANLLANYTALWHPALIASIESKPDWHQADNPEFSYLTYSDEENLSGDDHEVAHDGVEVHKADANTPKSESFALSLIPNVAKPMMDSELLDNLKATGAHIISELSSRAEIVQSALDASPHAQQLAEKVDPEIAKDFHALGYAFLQVQIMTRQLRYSSNLDEAYFTEKLVKAAKYATAGDHDMAREGLMKCFDILLEEKNAYYPVEPELIDVVLTAPTTFGKSFGRQLLVNHPLNFLLTGANARKLASASPENFELLKKRIQASSIDYTDQASESVESDTQSNLETDPGYALKASIIGGLQDELPETLISTESLVNQLRLGRQTIKELFNYEPAIFMRRRFGLTPATPGVLDQFNFAGAIHATLDDGKFPLCSSANIRWTGKDERSVLAFGDTPLSAADAGSFVGFGVKLGEAIDSAHVATVLFCHWPADTCETFDDLLRITNYSPLFGSFAGLDDYFDQVYDPGYGDTFTSDEYRNPYLKQSVEKQTPNPVSRFTLYWERFYRLNSCRSLLTQLCTKTPIDSKTVGEIQQRIGDLQSDIESALNADDDDSTAGEEIESLVAELTELWNPGAAKAKTQSAAVKEIINTTSFRRLVPTFIESSKTGTLKNQPPVLLADGTTEGSTWMLEVPSMGHVEISDVLLESAEHFKSDPKVVEPLTLRNEFFEVAIDERSGGIRSIQGYKTRASIVGQQLAIRIPSERDSHNQPLTKARYTSMVADSIENHLTSHISGTIISKGHLLDGSERLANFTQTVTMWRGKPIAEVKIEIELETELTPSVNHYVCSRLAWKNETARVTANTQEDRAEIYSDWFNATNFIEVDQDDSRLLMLTGGLPFHRRATKRMLDSLLIVGAETNRKFRIGLGVNVPYALAASIDWLTPVIVVDSQTSSLTEAKSGWQFHFNCKNIIVMNWQPLFEDGTEQWSGVRLRIKETEGRNGELSIRCPLGIASAQKENLAGDFLDSIDLTADESTKLELGFGRFDYFQLSINWKR